MSHWAVLLAACLLSFACGFWASDRRLAARAYAEGRRQLLEFAANADRLGILDRRRLDELTHDADDVAP